MSTVRAPSTLGKAGKVVWKSITSKYQLRPDELLLLEDVCAVTDTIASLEESWSADGRPMTTLGSMGQEVIHPLIGELRQQRMARNRLWAQLKLPDDAGAQRPNQQRQAAQSRWASAHGRSA